MGMIGRAITSSLAIAAGSATGCLDLSTSGAARDSIYMGEVGVQLKVGSGTLKTLRYSIANSTYNYQGSLDLAEATSVLAVIGGVHVGPGYVLALSGTTVEGAPCEGLSGHFGVFANNTAIVPIDVRCRVLRSVGAVCPTVPADNDGRELSGCLLRDGSRPEVGS